MQISKKGGGIKNRKRLTNRVVEYILKCKPSDFAELNVNVVARYLNVSVSHLSRDFKKNMKVSLHEYLLREKIKRACFLLKQNHRLSVKNVSQILDFCSCDYFIQIFKKYVGTTPGKFRKMDNGFFGLKDRRKGLIDRRSGLKDRKNRTSYNTCFNSDLEFKNRRTELIERRIDVKDRRKNYWKFINHSHH